MSGDLRAYVRPDLRDFAGYASARRTGPSLDGRERVWLNANEAAEPHLADPRGAARRYPDGQPALLRDRLAALWGAAPEALLVTRGSDEAIDVLVRTACTPGGGAVVTASPTFGMYAVAARLHGCRVVDVPQELACDPDDPVLEHARVDVDAVAESARRERAGVVFVASPGNPTGQEVPAADLSRLAAALRGRALVVVDEAYADFTDAPSAVALLAEHENLVVLRTLSKAFGLAGARIGGLVARPELVGVLAAVLPPYPLAEPATRLAEAATTPDGVQDVRARTARVLAERHRVTTALHDLARDGVLTGVLPSAANFVTVRCHDPQAVLDALDNPAGGDPTGVVVRSLASHPGLEDAVRITLGTPEQDDLVLARLAQVPPPAQHPVPVDRRDATDPHDPTQQQEAP